MHVQTIFRIILFAVVTSVLPDIVNDSINDLAGGAVLQVAEDPEVSQEETNLTGNSTRSRVRGKY